MKDIEALSALMDSRFKIFGLRIGLDGIIGLIPVVGDVATTVVSFYIVFRALSMKIPAVVILEMLFNVLIDFIFGVIPILGNIFDFIWKANEKNIILIKNYKNSPVRTQKKSNFLLVSLVSAVFLLFAALTYFVFVLFALVLKILF